MGKLVIPVEGERVGPVLCAEGAGAGDEDVLFETTGPAVGAFATGDLTGDLVGLTVADVFDAVGETVAVGVFVGGTVGEAVEDKVGVAVGDVVGEVVDTVGVGVGDPVGEVVGDDDGGAFVGDAFVGDAFVGDAGPEVALLHCPLENRSTKTRSAIQSEAFIAEM